MTPKKIVSKRKSHTVRCGLRCAVLKWEPAKLYTVLAAVRGADGEQNADTTLLKAGIVTRIRAILFTESVYDDIPGIVNCSPLSKREFKLIKSMVTLRPPSHFINHLERAVSITKTHKIWGGLGSHLDTYLTNLTRETHVTKT